VTLVFLHGAGFSGGIFSEQLASFPDASAPNLPGHLSAGSAQSIDEFAQFVEGYVRERDLREVVLCGHSMGGAVALSVALRGALDLRAIVLLGSGARLRVSPEILEGLQRDFPAESRRIARYFFKEATAEQIEWAAGWMERVGAEQTVRDFRACDAFDVIESVGRLRTPLLCLTGEGDRLTPPKFAHALASRVPGAQARILAGAGHFLMVERPAETNQCISEFVAGIQV
jgi:pimeloyl-ACP methyl ester carboxylesterase